MKAVIRKNITYFLGLFIFLGLLVGMTSCKKTPTGQSKSKYIIGIVTWVGYGPLFVAQEKGFFKQEGIKVEIKIMDGPGEREAAYLSGSLDLFPNTPDAFAIFATQGAKGKIVMPMDESAGADGLVAKKEITSVANLKGKKVGFQSGITSHFFLLYLLDQVGLSGDDVKQENLGAGEAGAAFVAGQLDAAVTWEPWLTKAKEMSDSHVLKSTKDTPGLLADVLLASDDMIQKYRKDLLAFMRAWFKGVEFLKNNRDESIQIIANAFKLDADEVKAMLTTDHFFTLEESKHYLGTVTKPGKVFEVFKTAARLYKANGVIDKIPQMEPMVDSSLLAELK